jgi:hypothetical protein
MRVSGATEILIDRVQLYASVKEASSNKLSLRKGVREQHDIRSGGGIKIGDHAVFLHPFHYSCRDKWNSPFSKFESKNLRYTA